MSKSPRRLLGRAADALAELSDIERQQPAVTEHLTSVLGTDGIARLAEARAVIAASALALRNHTDSAAGEEKPPMG